MAVDAASGVLRGHDPAAGQPNDTSILKPPKRANAPAHRYRPATGPTPSARPSRIRSDSTRRW